ncbi:MAG: type I DNA topoisomerase [Candidatus Peregrinibacteria bacterium]
MSQNLVIVESPAKAKTIEKFLGKEFTVKSSFGHIRDLPKSGMGIDLEGDFSPTYEISAGKNKVVAELKKAAKEATTVWLASDEDREGEAISWHLAEVLKLKPENTKRIVFHEITKTAIEAAIQNPRSVDQHLVDAQQARRVLDRLVGYELSPVLWRKIRAGLSAGRVQSVAVRLIVEREKEIEAFNSSSLFAVKAEFITPEGKSFFAECSEKFQNEASAKAFLETALTGEYTIKSVEKKPAKRSPAPPFTTSTLQQEAARKLGFSVKKTMMVAQKLYESGKITYMRTDSFNLSSMALGAAKEYIIKKYGENFSHFRTYTTKTKGAQEAHEAIRPTNLSQEMAGNEKDEERLYSLIWKRTIASQMSDAQFERTTAVISAKSVPHEFLAKGEVITFSGFLEVYLEGKDDEEEGEEGMLPALKNGDKADLGNLQAKQSFARPPARYSEAALVKKLEEMGIGRPSTYAPTISTVQDRGYIEKGVSEGEERKIIILSAKPLSPVVKREEKTEKTGSEKGKLVPTPIGRVVTDFLVEHFADIVDYGFTAKVEEEFDTIAEGKTKWNAMIKSFYGDFRKNIEEKMGSVSRADAIQERVLGTDPKSGKPVSARMGRFGPYIQIGTKDDEEKPLFASLRPGQNGDKITLEDALELFKLPRNLGKTAEGEEILTNFGRFGPYIKIGSLFVSIKKDPMEITLEEALEAIVAKKQAEIEKHIKTFAGTDIQILKGRWGPYISDGNKNAKIPKERQEHPETLTQEECEALLKTAPVKKGGWGKKKAVPAKITATKTSVKKPAAKKTAVKKAPVKKKA